MAKQTGILKLKGTLDGLNFYTQNGKQIVRKAGGGFNGKAIRNKASMSMVRENSIEFGHCSKVNKVFRTALMPFYKGQRMLPFHRRLMTLFTDLKDLDEISVRGQRVVDKGVQTEAGKDLLSGFNYMPNCNPKDRLPFDMKYDSQAHRLRITDLDAKHIRFPEGASQIQLQFGVLDFNFSTLQYVLYLSESIALDIDSPIATIEFPVQLPQETQGTLLAVLGIRFFLNGNEGFLALNGAESSGFCLIDVG